MALELACSAPIPRFRLDLVQELALQLVLPTLACHHKTLATLAAIVKQQHHSHVLLCFFVISHLTVSWFIHDLSRHAISLINRNDMIYSTGLCPIVAFGSLTSMDVSIGSQTSRESHHRAVLSSLLVRSIRTWLILQVYDLHLLIHYHNRYNKLFFVLRYLPVSRQHLLPQRISPSQIILH